MYTETHIAVFLTLAVLDFSFDFVLVALIASFLLDICFEQNFTVLIGRSR